MYALLIDPTTVAVLRPDGSEVGVVHLDEFVGKTKEILDEANLGLLSYQNSVSEKSLEPFREGLAPSRFLDVTDEAARKKFYHALRVSSRELIGYSTDRLRMLLAEYEEMQRELAELDAQTTHREDPAYLRARAAVSRRHAQAKKFKEEVLPSFEAQIGREMPADPEEAERRLLSVYATEGSSLVLARILFVRFFEDHDLTTRKISNGGIKAFRNFYRDIRDDYRHLLNDAFKDLERQYRRLFEPSVFDFSHEGDGELSRLLLRVFYRLNAFDFTKVTGDILGNLYERFLDLDARKKLGEYYTPISVARYVLQRIGFYDDPGPLLDPGNGSGTFLIAAIVGLIERLKSRGVSAREAVLQAVGLVHGLDLNMFAAFIAQLQLIWHLFPHLKEAGMKEVPDLNVYGGVNSLVFDPQRTLASTIFRATSEPAERPTRLRDSRYRYVVGNPPYIRNERLKDWGEWRAFYQEVDHKNSDVAFFFVKRAIDGGKIEEAAKLPSTMPPWLQDGGRMCWVLPIGVCDSSAALPLRQALFRYRILELTDLEDIAGYAFASPLAVSRGTVVPILLFVQRSPPDGNVVTLASATPASWNPTRLNDEGVRTRPINQSDLGTSPWNPYGQFLLKVVPEDVGILRKLMGHPKLLAYTLKKNGKGLTPIYGIKVGGAGRLAAEPAKGLRPLAKGLNVQTFFLESRTINRWVDLGKVEAKSIWAHPDLAGLTAYAVSEIAFAPQCAPFRPAEVVMNNSAVVFMPEEERQAFPWDVLINSSIIRFVHGTVLRAGLISHGLDRRLGRFISRAHIYPRVLEQFPVPHRLVSDPGPLIPLAADIRSLTESLSRRWQTVDDQIAQAPKTTLPLLGVDFTYWLSDEPVEGVQLARAEGAWKLYGMSEDQRTLSYLESSREVLNTVRYIFLKTEEGITKGKLETLPVPSNYEAVSRLIDDAENPDSDERRKFSELVEEADRVLAEGYGLTSEELEYIRKRVRDEPFDAWQPRWPWSAAEAREIQEYSADEDRFE